ncbi:MAG: hypothetical protein J6Z30_00110 [Pyramidobacter sp.]|nr:hypothetical protein [Pyramidobacter sp.]
MSNPEKKSFKVPHQLVILFAIAVLATIATYVVPAGTYNTVTVNGRKMIDATTFHYIAQTPVSPWDAFLALPGGFTKQVGIIAMIMMIAGAISIINETKCIDASIGSLVSKYRTISTSSSLCSWACSRCSARWASTRRSSPSCPLR